ncbi:MAG: MAPEG family protein [Myxococcota bacterium]
MSVPVAVLLGFAGWTLSTLVLTIGTRRIGSIAAGKAEPKDFRADVPHGSERYRQAMRAHANCVENLPVYGAVVLAIVATGVEAEILDTLALVFLAARVVQTTVHVVPPLTNFWVSIRFTFFSVQLICMAWMGAYVALEAV